MLTPLAMGCNGVESWQLNVGVVMQMKMKLN